MVYSCYKCLWVWTSFWKAWWKSSLYISSPTRHTELSLWTAAARGFSNTHKDYCQRATTETRTKPEPRTTADPHGRPVRPAHNIQNTLSGPIRLHSTQSISLADHGTGMEGKGGEITQRHGKMDRMGFLFHGMKPKPSRVNVQPSRGAETITNLISMVMNIN